MGAVAFLVSVFFYFMHYYFIGIRPLSGLLLTVDRATGGQHSDAFFGGGGSSREVVYRHVLA